MTEISENEFMTSLLDLADFCKLSSQALHQYLKKNGFEPVLVSKRAYLSPEETRRLLLKRGYKYEKKVVSLQMLKGGCSKTTSALNIGIRANMYGARVLLIDLDQQANLSFAFSVEQPDAPVWVNVVEGSANIEDVIKPITPSLHLIPSNLNNSTLDKVLLNGKRNIGRSMIQHLEKVMESYDLVVIDTAPNLSAINTAAACASDLVVLPVTPDKFSFSGLGKTLNDLRAIKSEFKAKFTPKVLFTRFDGRETASHELLKLCLVNHSEEMMKAFVRVSSEFKNTIKSGHTIYSKKGTAKEDYDLVTREIMGTSSQL